MSFIKLLKKFFLIFGSKLDRTLDELDSIKDRSRRIKKGYEEVLLRLTRTREDTEGKAALYEDKLKVAVSELHSLEKAMIKASSLKQPDLVLQEFNEAIEAAEQQIVVLQETYDLFAAQIVELDGEAKELSEDIRQASNTLDLAEVRYQAAKDLIEINSSGIPDNLRAQIEGVRKDADEMSARYKGVKRVKAKVAPTKEKLIKQFAPTRMSTEDRLKAIKDREVS